MSTQPTPDLDSLDRIPDPAWDALAQRRIYFGHQSVGDNILAGIAEILKLRPRIRLRVVESADPATLSQPVLAHSHLGANGDAESKIQAFADLMAAGTGDRAQIAMLKLCFVDIEGNQDPSGLFKTYSRTLTELEQRFPRVLFAHFTVPLTMIPKGPKSTVKRLLGRPLWGYEQNLKRAEYNRLLRSRYGAQGRVLDLAAWESTRPDGTVQSFAWRGQICPALVPMYTDDGGHLNASGRLVAAKGMLSWLAPSSVQI